MIDLTKMFLHEAPKKIFISINKKKNYQTDIAKQTNITYSHISLVLNKFNKNGLVKFKKQGRKKFINLTLKGKKIQDILIKLNHQLTYNTPKQVGEKREIG